MKRIFLIGLVAAFFCVAGCANEFIKIGNPTPSPIPQLPEGGADTPPDAGGGGTVTPDGPGKAFWAENPKWADGSTCAAEIDAGEGTAVFVSLSSNGLTTLSLSFGSDGSFTSDAFGAGQKLTGSAAEGTVKVIGGAGGVVATLARADFVDIHDYMNEIKSAESAKEKMLDGHKKKIYDMGKKQE